MTNRPTRWNSKAKYQAFHNFARRHFGQPNFCEKCKTKEKRMYHWAAKDKSKGGRERKDWLRLCVPCHAEYDGRTGKPISEEHKRKIGAKTAITSIGNTNAKDHKLSLLKRKEISEKTKLGMKRLKK